MPLNLSYFPGVLRRRSKFFSTSTCRIAAVALFSVLAVPLNGQSVTTVALLAPLTTYVNLVPASSGKFYGILSTGNINSCDLGCGTIFELSPNSDGSWNQATLHTFTGADGAWPAAGIIIDIGGNIFGTTYYGGSTYGSSSGPCITYGCGAVFELSPQAQGVWKETVLYDFTGGKDGWSPTGLAFRPSGSLVGTTIYGGSTTSCSPGCGLVFQLEQETGGTWKESVLHSFPGGAAGQNPVGMTLDSSGNILGTAGGGLNQCWAGYCGIVFKLSHSATGWQGSVVHSFHGSDGAQPNPSLTLDSAGNIYGTTYEGGNERTVCAPVGCGVVFELSLKNGEWKESILHSFADQADGEFPTDGLALDAQGNIYGGTSNGGQIADCNPLVYGACGQIFVLSAKSGAWRVREEIPSPGWDTPVGALVVASSGRVFGASCDEYYDSGGYIFEITF